jgi:CrcB protein
VVYTLTPGEVTDGTLLEVPTLLAVFLGGCVGGLARSGIATGPGRTLAVNLAGCLLLGVIAVTVSPRARLLLGTGFCGALTTFGSVAVHVRQEGAFGYLALSLLGGVAAASVGVWLAHAAGGGRRLAPEDPDV